MSPEQEKTRPFEALCELASRERWCWDLGCTTCGHRLFRYALRQLAAGRHPSESAWVVRSDRPGLKRRSLLRELGPLPPRGDWPVEEQRALINVLKAADIAWIASRCTFPDWLGYLGLGLHYTEVAEHETRELTRAWSPQLAEQVPDKSPAALLMRDVSRDEARTLSWWHLECVETSVRAR